MKKNKIISIICGLMIVITIVIMIIRLGIVATEHLGHPEWSLGVSTAVQLTAIFYSITIFILTIILVLINILKK